MNRIIEEIFEHRRILLQSLEKYGFEKNGDIYVVEKYIADRQMKMSIYVDSVGSIDTKVTDVDTSEEYTLFLTDVADGDFVNQVRNEYRQALTEIAENCCQSQVYKSPYTLALIDYVRDKYGDELEFIWKKFDDNAIWRRKDNKKWYGAILVVKSGRAGPLFEILRGVSGISESAAVCRGEVWGGLQRLSISQCADENGRGAFRCFEEISAGIL